MGFLTGRIRHEHLRGLPRRAYWFMATGVFFTFAPIMLLSVSTLTPERPAASVIFWAVVSGLVGCMWATAAVVSRRLIPVCVVIQIFVVICFSQQWPPGLGIGRPSVSWEAQGILFSVALGYGMMIRFIRMQGNARAAAAAEMALAGKIHATLVPPIDATYGRVSVVGSSRASTAMGGDLVDVVSDGPTVDVYLADVCGHGVKAGVVMAMVKSAIRMRLLARSGLDTLMTDLDRVIGDVVEPGMFATLACVRLSEDGRGVSYGLAGHLPILHFRGASGGFVELPNEHLPLGLQAGESFVARETRAAPGDLLVMYTDGLIEIQNKEGRLLGVERFKEIVARHARKALPEAFERIMAEANAFGSTNDDQTLVLVRVG